MHILKIRHTSTLYVTMNCSLRELKMAIWDIFRLNEAVRRSEKLKRIALHCFYQIIYWIFHQAVLTIKFYVVSTAYKISAGLWTAFEAVRVRPCHFTTVRAQSVHFLDNPCTSVHIRAWLCVSVRDPCMIRAESLTSVQILSDPCMSVQARAHPCSLV